MPKTRYISDEQFKENQQELKSHNWEHRYYAKVNDIRDRQITNAEKELNDAIYQVADLKSRLSKAQEDQKSPSPPIVQTFFIIAMLLGVAALAAAWLGSSNNAGFITGIILAAAGVIGFAGTAYQRLTLEQKVRRLENELRHAERQQVLARARLQKVLKKGD